MHLVKFKGYFKTEKENDYVSTYSNLNITLKIRKNPSSDLEVFDQIFDELSYQPLVESFKKHFPLVKELNIIDAGSNIGLTAVFLSRFFLNAKFICIEPDSSNFENMRDNLLFNGITNVVKVKGGLWYKETGLKLMHDFDDRKEWSTRVVEAKGDVDVQAFSIPFLLQQHHMDTIDILKIDIEGAEKEVFTHPMADTSFLNKTKSIAIEIHDEFGCRENIYAILKKANFSYFQAGELTIGINQNFIERA